MKTNGYNALEVARYIISKCTNDNQPISNLQLQKILYFLQCKFIKEKKYPLFVDEIEAWQFGPVVPEVYYEYCGFGSMDIIKIYNTNISAEDKLIINPIVENKRGKAPWILVEETHARGKAWDCVYRDGEGNRNIISKELIAIKG